MISIKNDILSFEDLRICNKDKFNLYNLIILYFTL
jgi:hypothetical protein